MTFEGASRVKHSCGHLARRSNLWSQDACTYDSIYNEAKTSSFGLKASLMAIIHAKNFTQRVQDK